MDFPVELILYHIIPNLGDSAKLLLCSTNKELSGLKRDIEFDSYYALTNSNHSLKIRKGVTMDSKCPDFLFPQNIVSIIMRSECDLACFTNLKKLIITFESKTPIIVPKTVKIIKVNSKCSLYFEEDHEIDELVIGAEFNANRKLNVKKIIVNYESAIPIKIPKTVKNIRINYPGCCFKFEEGSKVEIEMKVGSGKGFKKFLWPMETSGSS